MHGETPVVVNREVTIVCTPTTSRHLRRRSFRAMNRNKQAMYARRLRAGKKKNHHRLRSQLRTKMQIAATRYRLRARPSRHVFPERVSRPPYPAVSVISRSRVSLFSISTGDYTISRVVNNYCSRGILRRIGNFTRWTDVSHARVIAFADLSRLLYTVY